MAAILMDGAALAAELRLGIAKRVEKCVAKGARPGLAVVLVGDDPASVSYVTGKERACAELGIESFEHRLPADCPQAELNALVRRLNADPRVHGILVQFPLPKPLDEISVIDEISPEKDVDGLTPSNVGLLCQGRDCFIPCTPHGVIKLLEKYDVPTKGSRVVIIGRSNLVGRPLANLLSQKRYNATVSLCHSATKDLAAIAREADILVAAIGSPGFVKADMVKPGAVIIDVGINRVSDPGAKNGFRLKGDVDFEAAKDIASRITPVPKGVGPLTITMLLDNVAAACERAIARGAAAR
jgi:methylenetetrahydrofolate dehydrogenase (NADP+)/methenyltetrahydrofolate cyclohydrolase